ncbi:hypothetical protein [Skermania piniformis]|uniref:MYXO-CTERM domain-containing protein n=1 Tax=Skermania pinensis TaxID=39122 RepID=A0ABX8S7J4_9ACTN|nr:hypothetical protein [Skermania piniformis]QXQ13809.1 hypothetical protein KV203_18865 [Skermania piniformis]
MSVGGGGHPIARRQRLEVLIGILAFFTLPALVAAVAELFREPPGVVPASVLAGVLALLGLAVAARRRSN